MPAKTRRNKRMTHLRKQLTRKGGGRRCFGKYCNQFSNAFKWDEAQVIEYVKRKGWDVRKDGRELVAICNYDDNDTFTQPIERVEEDDGKYTWVYPNKRCSKDKNRNVVSTSKGYTAAARLDRKKNSVRDAIDRGNTMGLFQ